MVDLGGVPRFEVPLVLAQAHWRTQPGSTFAVEVRGPGRDRGWSPEALADVVVGAGFTLLTVELAGGALRARATRARSLPDTVGPAMRLLFCGLNPSEYAADRGVGYARPGNRFWPAVLEAGVVTRSHDPIDALVTHGVGMTDLVKRATPRASELSRDEYRAGEGRVGRLVRWLRPAAVCFVGLEGWRAAVDPKAVPGPQPGRFAGRPVYLMPSTSGLNAHVSRPDLVRHMAAAADLADAGQDRVD